MHSQNISVGVESKIHPHLLCFYSMSCSLESFKAKRTLTIFVSFFFEDQTNIHLCKCRYIEHVWIILGGPSKGHLISFSIDFPQRGANSLTEITAAQHQSEVFQLVFKRRYMLLFFDLPFDNFHLTRFLPDDEQGKINKKLDSSQFDRSTTTVTVVVVRYQTECFHVYFSDKLHVALQRKEGRRSSFKVENCLRNGAIL